MLRIFLLNLLVNCLLSEHLFAQTTVPDDTLQSSSLVLTFLKRNGSIKEVHLPPGSHVEISLRTPKDSLIDYYDHTVEGKLITCTDSTFTLAATGSYRYINYTNGSWLEDYFNYPADSAIRKTIHLDSVTCIYSNREWLSYPRKVSLNLTRIFIGVSTINSLSGNGSIINSVLFALGVAGIYGEFALGGKKYRIDHSESRPIFRRRIWKVHRE